jgi:phenylacetate-CoA ligase
VVVTSLHNFATPLLRYEIGDYAQVGPPCTCGRGLPVLSKIMGRVRNMLRLPGGRRVWPNFGWKHFAEVLDVRQFQLVQHNLGTLELKLVTPEAVTRDQEERLRGILAANLGHTFDVRISRHRSIPRSAGGKFEDFQSLLDEDTQG